MSYSGYHIFMRNLYAQPAEPADGVALWFPYRGIPAF
jgi:hypothetical protein